MDSLLSVGIDIGTSTTSMVVSRLQFANTAACFAVPRVAITETEIVYRSKIYPTPQAAGNRIDAAALADLLQAEYRLAGITPDLVQTGAVIITGESSRKENAALVTAKLSALAGEFVVATAGPDLESIIAAQGAGTAQYSAEHGCRAANFDVGGGTTNIAVYRNGLLEGQGCFDVGGRLIRIADGKIVYVSPAAAAVIAELQLVLQPGDAARTEQLRQVADRLAGVLVEAAGLAPRTELCSRLVTSGATVLQLVEAMEYVSFSGGVADYIYHPTQDWFRHGDVGPLLAASIRSSPLFADCRVIVPRETIRATVVGAGSYTTTVSGSTIDCTAAELLPLKNIPAFVASEKAEEQAGCGEGAFMAREARWFLQESAADNLIFCLNRINLPGYWQVCALANALTAAAKVLPPEAPLLVLTGQDFAKALGQALRRRVRDRAVICIDNIVAQQGDYLDLGRPLMNGVALPVIVKTLIFG